MNARLLTTVGLVLAASIGFAGCGGDDDATTGGAGKGGSAAKGGKGGSGGATAGKGGSTSGSGGKTGGTGGGGTGGSGGTSGRGGSGGKGGATGGTGGMTGGAGGSSGSGATAGTNATGGLGAGGSSAGTASTTGGSGGESAGEGGMSGAGGSSGEAGAAGAAGAGPDPMKVARGAYLVRTVALCGGCHTGTGALELGGNPNFKGGTLPAPNLTPDATGIGSWTDAQIITAFRDGIDDEGRHLDPAMPYWFFHNLSDDDATAIVAFLRSLPASSGEVGASNPDATPVTPLSVSSFPDTTLTALDTGYAAAVQGRYLLSSAARCVSCHSPSSGGLPSGAFFSGQTPGTSQFGSNLTPDTTGLAGWTPQDVATALKSGTNKDGATLCGSMPSAGKGYGNLTDADALAIGTYLTTIPAVSNAASDFALEPACN